MKKHLLIGIPIMILDLMVWGVFFYMFSRLNIYQEDLLGIEALSYDSYESELKLICCEDDATRLKDIANKIISQRHDNYKSLIDAFRATTDIEIKESKILLIVFGVMVLLINAVIVGIYPLFRKNGGK